MEAQSLGGFEHILFWHWWIAAALLVLVELVRPGFVFLWLGFAAAAVGFLLLLFPSLPAHVRLALFAFLSVVAGLAWHHYRKLRKNAERSR